MGLEADDGRPETSPPPRRGVQTADRAVVRERQAIPGDQGRARHRAIDPAALGTGHPRQRLHPGRGQPHARAERAGRAGEARPTVGDGGGRFRTSGAGIRTKAGVIRANAARCPISARCGIPDVPRSTCYWMTGHPGTERADPVAGDVRAVRRDSRERYGARKIKAALERKGVTASRRRIGNIMREQGMTGAYARGRSEPHGTRADEAGPANLPAPRVRRLRPAHASGGRSYLCPRRRRLGVRVPAGRSGGQGHRRPFRRADPGREPGIGRVRHPRLPAGGRPGVPHRPGRRVRQHEDRRAARRVRHQKIAVAQGQPLRQRRGRIDEQAAEEGARVPEPLRHDRAAEARPRRLRVVVRRPAAPLHPWIPESEGIHRTGTRPLRNRPTHRCQSKAGSTRRSSPGNGRNAPGSSRPRDSRTRRTSRDTTGRTCACPPTGGARSSQRSTSRRPLRGPARHGAPADRQGEAPDHRRVRLHADRRGGFQAPVPGHIGFLRDPERGLHHEHRVLRLGTRARRQEHGRRVDRPHRAPRQARRIRGRLLPQRARPHDQTAKEKGAAGSDGAVSAGNQPPMLLKNSAHTVDANLQKHIRAASETAGRGK